MTRLYTALALLLAIGIAVTALGLSAAPARAEEPTARTATDASIDPSELELRLFPLRRDQLQAEAEAWVGLLEGKVEEVSLIQVEIARAEGEQKDQLLEQLSQRKEEKADILKRVGVAIDAWTAKGGDASELETYVSEVSGIKIDLTDTTAVWATFTDWLKAPDGGRKLGMNLLWFVLILIAAKILSRILARIVSKALLKLRHTPELLRNFLANTVRNITFFVGLVVALGVLGVNIGPFLAAIGAAGFVIAFALQGTLSNFANGVMILIYRPFDTGDVVTVSGVTGKVDAMTLVSTTIKTADNQIVIVPNSQIWGNVITNITGSPTRRVDMVFGIGYDDDMKKAQKVLEDIIGKHPLVLEDPEPSVAVAALADSSVNFNVRPWSKTSDYWTVFLDVTRQVKERFDEEGISIPYPQQDVHMHTVSA